MAKTKKDEAEVEGVSTTPRPTPRDVDPASVEAGNLSDAEIIARRSQDIEEPKAKGSKHVKVFVLPAGPKPIEANGYDHSANKAATVQYAISQGLRPKEEGFEAVSLDSIEQHENGLSWVLTYSVEVDPAEKGLRASGPDVVTKGVDVSTNTDGNGHSNDSRPKTRAARI